MLVFPRTDGNTDGSLNMAYLGDVPHEIEGMIHVCKAATLLSKIHNLRTGEEVDVPFGTVARIIGTINARTGLELSKSFHTVRRRAVYRADCEKRSIRPYCEGSGIS